MLNGHMKSGLRDPRPHFGSLNFPAFQTCQFSRRHAKRWPLCFSFQCMAGYSWEDRSMEFVFRLVQIIRMYDSIFVLVNRLSKMVHFIPCQMIDDAKHAVNLFFR